jgi:hypothetical protein
MEQEYIKSVNERELKSLKIAEFHLGSSFELCKSVGFIKWKSEQNQSIKSLTESTASTS